MTQPRFRLRCPVLDHQAASDGSEGLLHLTDVGALVGVQQLAYGALAQTQASGEGNLGDALAAHRRIEGELGRGNGRNGDEFLARGRGAWSRDLLTALNAGAQGRGQGILGHVASGTSGKETEKPPPSSGVSTQG